MKQVILFIMGAVAGLVLLATPVQANVNNFHISNYDIQYVLGRDSDGRSTLRTTETITAEFPQHDQNRGIERYIPRSYDGHPLSLRVDSIKDGSQSSWNYTTYDSGEYIVVRIGDADRYVRGQQTYVLEYTQRDVTKSFNDTGADEFYWDTNGTEWAVPISRLNVSLKIDDSIASEVAGQSSCYIGRYGSTDRCEVASEGTTHTASAINLPQGENITLAFGFKPGTFSAYEPTSFDRFMSAFAVFLSIWFTLQGILIAVSVGLTVWLAVRFSSWSRRSKDVGTIIPEYLPPRDSSVSLSATLVTTSTSFTAQLIDLAVRRYLKIYEIKAPSTWVTGVYQMEIVRPIDDLREEEKEFLSDIFKGFTQVGAKVSTDELKKDYSLSSRLLDNPAKIQGLKRGKYGIQQKNPEQSAWFKKFSKNALIAGLILLSPGLLVLSLIAYIMSLTLWPLTDRGLGLFRYLQGLKLYISVAEQDRLRMLQSPEGAQKVQVDASDPKALVKLYERVLPYAMLFGQEKQWNKQLGNYYQSTGVQPDWYAGANLAAFNAVAFSSAMTNLTSSINSTGASHSSSGGSSGGGSSGGGGGGGGGGGW